jgi:hypothetical protein
MVQHDVLPAFDSAPAGARLMRHDTDTTSEGGALDIQPDQHSPDDETVTVIGRDKKAPPGPLRHRWNVVPCILLAAFCGAAGFYLYIRFTTLTSENLHVCSLRHYRMYPMNVAASVTMCVP